MCAAAGGRGEPGGRMHVASLPGALQGVFRARLAGMQRRSDSPELGAGSEGLGSDGLGVDSEGLGSDGLGADSEGLGADGLGTDSMQLSSNSGQGSDSGSEAEAGAALAAADFVQLQRGLRLAVELHAHDSTVTVFQTLWAKVSFNTTAFPMICLCSMRCGCHGPTRCYVTDVLLLLCGIQVVRRFAFARARERARAPTCACLQAHSLSHTHTHTGTQTVSLVLSFFLSVETSTSSLKPKRLSRTGPLPTYL